MNPVLVDGVLWIPVRAEIPGIYGDLMEPLDRSDPSWDEWFAELQPGPEQHGWEEIGLAAAAWDPAKHPRDELGRWAEVHEALVEEKSQVEKVWASEPDMENDFYSDYYRLWADNQFGNGGHSTLPDDWQKGWTWGEDAEAVDRAIYESAPLVDDIAVWRGAYNQSGEPSSRPISTSFEKGVALAYADRTGRDQETHLIRVLVPAGSHVGWHTNESEIVLPTGTRLEQRGDEWVAVVPTEMVEGLRSSGWDESKHPRDPGGEGGGQFVTAEMVEADAPVMGLGDPARREAIEQRNDSLPFGFDRFKKGEIEAGLKEFLDTADLSMRVPESAFLEMLEDGEFMNQHEHGEGSRGLQREVKSEASMLGLPGWETATADQLPKYAYLGPDNSQVNMYGPLKIYFKDEVKDRTTFTVGDSLMTNAIPSKVRDPWWGSAGDSVEIDVIPSGEDWSEMTREETGGFAYMEAQIYGKLTPSDIHRVEVLAEDYWSEEDPNTGTPMVDDVEKMNRVLDELTRRGIDWGEYTPEGDFSGEWA